MGDIAEFSWRKEMAGSNKGLQCRRYAKGKIEDGKFSLQRAIPKKSGPRLPRSAILHRAMQQRLFLPKNFPMQFMPGS
jgi:hypothetical protein